MRLESADLYTVAMPLVTPFEASGHRTTVRETLLVALHAGGATGWGEVVADPRPWYTGETLIGATHILRDHLLPSVLGQDVPDLATFLHLTGWVRGNPMARAGLELAWWDLLGQQAGQSLRALLGGVRDRVAVGVSVGIQPDLDALVATVGAYRAQGYGRVKIKVKPGWLADPIRALRAAFGPDLPLQVDANSAFTLADAPLLAAIDDAGLLLIEQPLADDDLVDHAALQAQLQTPICLDESIDSYATAAAALALGACRVINIKPGRVGGLSVARAIHDLCQAQGVPVWCGGMLETGIGRAANLALASLPGFTLPGDISASRRYYHADLITQAFELNAADSTIAVPTGPGLGITVDTAELARVTLRRETIRLS
jgi:O-succinylbenzoate synthase